MSFTRLARGPRPRPTGRPAWPPYSGAIPGFPQSRVRRSRRSRFPPESPPDCQSPRSRDGHERTPLSVCCSISLSGAKYRAVLRPDCARISSRSGYVAGRLGVHTCKYPAIMRHGSLDSCHAAPREGKSIGAACTACSSLARAQCCVAPSLCLAASNCVGQRLRRTHVPNAAKPRATAL